MNNVPDMLESFKQFAVCVLFVFLFLVAVANGPTEPPCPATPSAYIRPQATVRPACPAAHPFPYLPEDHVEPTPEPVYWSGVPGDAEEPAPTFLDLTLEGMEDGSGLCYCFLKARPPCFNCRGRARLVAQRPVTEQGVGE